MSSTLDDFFGDDDSTATPKCVVCGTTDNLQGLGPRNNKGTYNFYICAEHAAEMEAKVSKREAADKRLSDRMDAQENEFQM